jgi:hypothetical protein
MARRSASGQSEVVKPFGLKDQKQPSLLRTLLTMPMVYALWNVPSPLMPDYDR